MTDDTDAQKISGRRGVAQKQTHKQNVLLDCTIDPFAFDLDLEVVSTAKKILGGRPPVRPTAEQRKTVKAMTACGISQAEVCLIMGISKPTLHKHYRHELDTAMAQANAAVGKTAFKLATSGKCVAATIFWAKTRMGWTEKQSVEITGKEEGPLQSITTQDPR